MRKSESSSWGSVARGQQGSAGKVFLIILASLVLLAVAGIALWKPVIEPRIGEIIPERVSAATEFSVPAEEPRLTFLVPKDWVVQRAVFDSNQAVISTPDLALEIVVDPWREASAPSLPRALETATSHLSTTPEPRTEILSDTLRIRYVVGAEPDSEQDVLIAVLGVESDPEVSPKAVATLTVRTPEEPLEDYLPTLALLLQDVRIER